MNGIKLKSEKLSPLKIEKIKWISLLILSHFFSFLLMTPGENTQKEKLPKLKDGHTRLQLKINSQVPENSGNNFAIIMTNEKDIISRKARLLKKIQSQNSLNLVPNVYLVEMPEQDLNNLVHSKAKPLLAYPASNNIKLKKPQSKEKNYEIYF